MSIEALYRQSDALALADALRRREVSAAGPTPPGRSGAPETGWPTGCGPARYGATVNPWNPALAPGGAAGGSGAAAVSRMAPLAREEQVPWSARRPEVVT